MRWPLLFYGSIYSWGCDGIDLDSLIDDIRYIQAVSINVQIGNIPKAVGITGSPAEFLYQAAIIENVNIIILVIRHIYPPIVIHCNGIGPVQFFLTDRIGITACRENLQGDAAIVHYIQIPIKNGKGHWIGELSKPNALYPYRIDRATILLEYGYSTKSGISDI